VKHRITEVFLLACGALSGAQAVAQPLETPRRATVKAANAGPLPAEAAKTQTALATVKSLKPLAASTIAATGSSLLLADGIVADSSIVQVQSPAAGFAYER
jgi:hypothetical protein